MNMWVAHMGQVVGYEWGELMKGLGLGFTNLVDKGGVLDVCLCLVCSGRGGVGGEWVGNAWGLGTGSGMVGWCFVCVSCESL